jgi:hypothetical protein
MTVSATVVLAIVGGVVLVAGALLTGLALALARGPAAVARRSIEVTAQVVGSMEIEGEADPIYGGGGGGHAPVVSFRTRDGEVVAASSQRVYRPRRGVPTVGTAMRVRYDPWNPRQIHIRGWDAPARFVFVDLVTGGVIVTLLGAFLIVIAFTAT